MPNLEVSEDSSLRRALIPEDQRWYDVYVSAYDRHPETMWELMNGAAALQQQTSSLCNALFGEGFM